MGIQTITNININTWFYGIMGVLITLFLFGLIISPLGNQLNVFFIKTNNLFADFFNVQIYIADWDPYHNTVNGLGEKCYLPFTYLFLELFNGFFHYSGASLSDCYSSSSALMSCFFFIIISLFLLYNSMDCFLAVPGLLKFILLFSSILLFSIERANIIILCAAFVFYYLAYKDSKDKRLRIFALLCLCLVSVIKIYPVIFGIYLFKERRYKDIMRCIIFSLFLIFVPFLFFRGQFDNISQMMDNSSMFLKFYGPYSNFPRFGLTHVVAWGLIGFNVDRSLSDLILVIPKLMVALACIFSILLFFYERNTWKKIALLSIPLIMLPTNSGFYCGLYFLPVIVTFLYKNDGRRIDFVYMLFICLFLNPFQLSEMYGINISQFLSNIALLVMWAMLLVDCSINLINKRRINPIISL